MEYIDLIDRHVLDYYLWKNIQTFILNSQSSKDKLLRIISVNKILSHDNSSLSAYITQHQNKPIKPGKIPFNEVKYNDIIHHSNMLDPPYYSKVLKWNYLIAFRSAKRKLSQDSNYPNDRSYLNILCWFCGVSGFLFIAVPLWIISRIFKIIFPTLILVYLIYYDLWSTIDSFQITMLFTYILITTILWILFIHVYKLYHSMWHINPSYSHKKAATNETMSYYTIKNIHKYYNDCISIPLILQHLINIFGRDIGYIINNYIHHFDKWDSKSLFII